MSFFGNVLNGIPGVGHVKGFVHYATGDQEAGDRAMMAATRTTAVMAGGAVGMLGGPAGVVAGATGAGLLMDSATSLATGRPQGIIEGIDDIVTDIDNGDVPVGSVLKTGLFVGADALSGFGGGSIASNVGGTMGKSMAKDAAVIVAKNASACQMAAVSSLGRSVAEEAPRSQPRYNSGSSSNKPSNKPPPSTTTNRPPPTTSSSGQSNSHKSTSTGSGSGSGSQPPRRPNQGKKSHGNNQVESHLDAFLRLFNVTSLDDVVIRGVRLFRNLQRGQLNTLKKLIKQLRLNGTLTRVIETVRNLLNKVETEEITFQNYLSLTQFVSAFLAEQTARRCEAQRGVNRASPFEDRRDENLNHATSAALLGHVSNNILRTFKNLCAEIGRFSCDPDFRNIFSAVYHYFKHKLVPQTDRELSVANYYYLIQFLLDRVKLLVEYRQLTDQTHTRRELVFDRVFNVFGRFVKVRIVIKVQDGNLELSSCYILDDDCDTDDEGDEYIDADKDRS